MLYYFKKGSEKLRDRIKKIREDAHLTQEKFAQRIGIKRNTVATYETTNKIPMDTIITSICREFDVNKEWLVNGIGSPYIEISRGLQITRFLGEVLKEQDDSFKKRFVNVLAKLELSDWKVLENIAESIYKKPE